MPVYNPPNPDFRKAHPTIAGLLDAISLSPVSTPVGAESAVQALPKQRPVGAASIQVVPETSIPQEKLPWSDSDALSGLVKYGAAKVPSARALTPATAGQGMGTSAQGVNDLLTPDNMKMMDKMYNQANPSFKALQEQGAFSGPRTTGKF